MSRFDFRGRLDRARVAMAQHGIEAMLLSIGADLPYFTGYEAMPLERLTMAVVPVDGEVSLVVPELEAPRVTEQPGTFAIFPWTETEDPVAMVARLVGARRRLAIGDETWSVFFLALQERLPGSQIESATPITRQLRMRKEHAEVGWLARAALSADRVAARLPGLRFEGHTERWLAGEIGTMLVAEGHDVSQFVIVASGPNSASPHHEASDRVMQRGDAVVVDFGGRLGGYCSDTTRTFHIGPPPPAFLEVFDVVHAAQEAGVEAARAGVACSEVDRAARSVVSAAGFGEHFIHRTGHGIGLEVHEHPYLVEGDETRLESGMVFSVEPGVYLPGRFGVRIEDIVAITTKGRERLNISDRELIVVE